RRRNLRHRRYRAAFCRRVQGRTESEDPRARQWRPQDRICRAGAHRYSAGSALLPPRRHLAVRVEAVDAGESVSTRRVATLRPRPNLCYRPLMPLRPLALLLLLTLPALARDYQRPVPIQVTHDSEKWAEKTLRKLALEEKIGQMILMRGDVEFMNVASPEFLRLRDQIT